MSRRAALWGLLLAATLVGAWLLLRRVPGGLSGLFQIAASIHLQDFFELALLGVVFAGLDGVRVAAPLRLLGHAVSVIEGAGLAAVSYFVASLTPVAELHVPAMVWLLGRRGVPAGQAAAAMAVKSLVFTLYVCAAGALGLVLGGGSLSDPRLRQGLAVGALLLLPIVALFAALVAAPGSIAAWAGPRIEAARGLRRKLFEGAAQAAAAVATVGRSKHADHFALHAAAIGAVFVYAAIGHEACAAVGIDLSWPRALAAFSAGLMVAYLAPIPGSIGVAEVAQAWLIDPALPPRAVAAAAVVRVLCWYAPAAVGAVLMAQAALTARADPPPETRS